MADDWLTAAEAAQLKGVTRSAVYKAIAQKNLLAERVLGRLALRRAELEVWKPKERRGRRKGTRMSDEARERISQGQKRRWEQRKADPDS
jgi:excisionase family DNA binding protein